MALAQALHERPYTLRARLSAHLRRTVETRADLVTLPSLSTLYPRAQSVSVLAMGSNPLDTRARIGRSRAYPTVNGPSQDSHERPFARMSW